MKFEAMNNKELLSYALQQSHISKEHDENSRSAYSELKRRRLVDMPDKYAYVVDKKAADGQVIIDGDVNALGFEVRWSIYKDTTGEFCKDWICNFYAPEGVPDGVYEVEGAGWDKLPEVISGIEVKNGRFVPTTTMKTIQNLMRILDDRHHIFIEGLDWDGERFHLVMGS